MNNFTHMAAVQRIKELNRKLEIEAAEAYHKHKDTVRPCCGKAPFHSFDSFGMPLHTLKCCECGRTASGKTWDSLIEWWEKQFEEEADG